MSRGFRVWDKIDKKYIEEVDGYGLYISLDGDVKINEYGDMNTFFDRFILERDSGLTDKNGNKIFDGDRVKLDLNNEGFVKAVVIFKYGCYVFDTPKEIYTVWESDVLENHIEVIGNIHEEEPK